MKGMLVAVLVGLAASGCTTYGELRSVVRAATPPSAETIGECQEFGVYGVIDDPVYGCAYFVPGTRTRVASAIAESLVAEGFDARCEEDPSRGILELNAQRGRVIVYGEVSKRGSVITMFEDEPLNIAPTTRFITSDYLRAPPANVIVKLAAGEYETRTLRGDWSACAAVLANLD